MKKIALVFQKTPSNWVSCRSITRNLAGAYRQAFPGEEFRGFFLEAFHTPHQMGEVAQEVAKYSPDRICFIDHVPHAGFFLRSLKAANANGQLPEIVFHAFGDFTLHPNEWLGLEKLLAETRCRFICASERQQRLLLRLIEGAADLIPWVPFPVDSSAWSFSKALVASSRERFRISLDDFVFVYSGRISLQKNVHALIRPFAEYLRKINPRALLLLAGPIDQMGLPYLGQNPAEGWYPEKLVNQIERWIPGEFRSQVRYLGELDAEPLRQVCHAADCYISLSTHNDEDFGMAPAEASLCGLPLLLTDWGGFSSFEHLGKEWCHFIPVKLGASSVLPDSIDVLRAMVKSSLRRPTEDMRQAIAHKAASYYSTESVARRLTEVLEEPFSIGFRRFTEKFHAIGRAYQMSPQAPFLSGHGYSKLYREVYGSYLR